MKNISSIRKKLFVKEKGQTFGKMGNFARQSEQVKMRSRLSVMSEVIKDHKEDEHDFVLLPPPEKDPNYLKTRIYFFSTPQFLDI